MTTPYSLDLRAKVVAAAERGVKTRVIASLLGVSSSWVRRVKQRKREHGETGPRRMGSPGVRKFDRDQLRRLVTECPDATLPELRELLGGVVGTTAISKALVDMGLSFKKRHSRRRNVTAPTSWRVDRNGANKAAPSMSRS